MVSIFKRYYYLVVPLTVTTAFVSITMSNPELAAVNLLGSFNHTNLIQIDPHPSLNNNNQGTSSLNKVDPENDKYFLMRKLADSNLSISKNTESVSDFSLTKTREHFDPGLSRKNQKPTWTVTVSINASLQHLSQISSVVYHIKQPRPRPSTPATATNATNHFALYNGNPMEIKGGFPLYATLYFKNGKHLDTHPLSLVALIPPNYPSPVQFALSPIMDGSNVTIYGTAKSNTGQTVNSTTVGWGDGTNNTQARFPFSHKYSKLGNVYNPGYTITLIATLNTGISYSADRQTVLQTAVISLANSIPQDSSYKVWKGQYVLTVLTSDPTIPENAPSPFTVWGRAQYVNGTGIPEELIPIEIVSHSGTYHSTPPAQRTHENGNYTYKVSLPPLDPDQYNVVVGFPPSSKYAGLTVTKALFVVAHPISATLILTWLTALIGAAVAVIGLIVTHPATTSKKQASHLADYMTYIYSKHNEFKNDENNIYNKQKFLINLQNTRHDIISSLRRGEITDTQFSMLDDKISDYVQKINNA